MIEKIKIKNIATFNGDTVIENIKKINFFYGANGSGKTTISRVIANPEHYNDCEINWLTDRKLKVLTLNEDFVREYFYEKDKLKGIYTIGEGAKDFEEKIEKHRQIKEDLLKEVIGLTDKIEKNKKEKVAEFNKFKENCWQIGYIELQNDFDLFFTGYKNNKEKLADKILKEKSNDSELLEKDKIKEKYELIYGEDIQKINEVTLISSDDIKIVEDNQSILKTSVIGKKDVNIARLIEKLHNNDWVRQGKIFYEKNFDEETNAYICPFCQQPTTEDFKKQLEEYFDETYNQKIKELENFSKEYKQFSDKVISNLKQMLTVSNQYIDRHKITLNDKHRIIKEILEKNSQLLDKKLINPSEKIALETIIDKIEEINSILSMVNSQIREHNQTIDNRNQEKVNLDKNLWKFIVNNLKNYINDYEDRIKNIDKALENLNKGKSEKETKIKECDDKILDLEKNIKSVNPTVEAINKILKNFGFKGFRLKATDDDKHYLIVRDDGKDAKATLSEGERNFLVFLYFYHLIYGVESPDESITQDKILVIDDPVSSLDSDILFIVSTLIRNILDRVRNNNDNVKQIFIFTHNTYFYKEITFISSRESCYNKRKDTKYYIVRKKDNESFIEQYEICPIKTSYQLLWDDLKKDNIDSISVQNSMRRIIEFYFKFLAGLHENELLNKFSDQEKLTCKSLVSWVNIGSHEIFDDFNISISNEQIGLYKNVFKKIFEVTGHIAHYNMMMGINT